MNTTLPFTVGLRNSPKTAPTSSPPPLLVETAVTSVEDATQARSE
jgi:hypothetical protein